MTETVAIAPKPDGVEREETPQISENEHWAAYAARLIAWGNRGWTLAETRLDQIRAAHEEAQAINQD